MRRLARQLALDVRIQYRNGFYAVSLLIAVPAIILLRFLDDAALAWVLPLVLFQNTLINAFYFIAGLILLEKAEGCLAAQAVSPLRGWEYLGAKVLTLAGLSTLEGLAIARLCYGGALNLPALAYGLFSAAVLLALLGLALMTRYDSINRFLMPSVAYTILLCLPILKAIGALDGALLYLHPLQPSMEALGMGFGEAGLPPSYWLGAGLPWVALLAWIALRLYRRRLAGAIA